MDTKNFRDNPALLKLVRTAIAELGQGLPNVLDEVAQEWLMRYRESVGERTTDSVYSYAKTQYDRHFSLFRSQYPKVLGQYLVSQIDRAQGRESPWPAYDAQVPSVMSDEVMARRMLIDELTRVVDAEQEEGLRVFEPLLAEALGCSIRSTRDNPLRPAVFFHALGLTWTQVSESDRDEMFMLANYAGCLGAKVAAVYPKLTALLRESLGRPKPEQLNILANQSGGPIYGRRKQSNPPDVENNQAGSKPEMRALRAEQKIPGPDPSPQPLALIQEQLGLVRGRLEPVISDEAIHIAVRLAVSRIQAACTARILTNLGQASSEQYPLWPLIEDLGDITAWRQLRTNRTEISGLLMHLNIIRELLSRNSAASKDSGQGKEDDWAILEHLRAQLKILRVTPNTTGLQRVA